MVGVDDYVDLTKEQEIRDIFKHTHSRKQRDSKDTHVTDFLFLFSSTTSSGAGIENDTVSAAIQTQPDLLPVQEHLFQLRIEQDVPDHRITRV